MANHRCGVVGGVDAHADEHHVAVVDLQGRLLGLLERDTADQALCELNPNSARTLSESPQP